MRSLSQASASHSAGGRLCLDGLLHEWHPLGYNAIASVINEGP